MSKITDFVKDNIYVIMVTVTIILTLLVLINILGIDLNAPQLNTKLIQQVTVETFEGSTV
jgi:hypothetical protein